MEKSFGRKVLEQTISVNNNINKSYFEIDMETEDGVLTQEDAIKKQIEIWMNTNIGERNWDPDYGNPLIAFIHKRYSEISQDDILSFFDKLEFDVDTITVNRSKSTAFIENSILKIRMVISIIGIPNEVSLASDIS